MKKRIEFAIFWIVILSIAIIVFRNLEIVKEEIGQFIILFGYPAVLVLSALTDALEQPIGPEVPSILALLFGLNPLIVMPLAFLGTSLGSLISFYIGTRFLTKRISHICSNDGHVNLCKLFSKYGKWEIAIAAVSPIPYVTSCWLAGAFNMHIKDFIIFGILPRLLRLSVIVTVFFIGFRL